MQETILITGGNGSGGSYLVEYIVKTHPNVSVHVTNRWHSTTSQNNLDAVRDKITIHECDLNDLPSIIRILRKIKPDKIFNMASHANVRVCFDTPIAVLQNNIFSTANLLEAIRLECPSTVFQHCSTSEVYGNPTTGPITEDFPLAPVNPYAVSKLTQESLCFAYFKSWGVKIVTTRMFAYINPRRREIFSTAFAQQVADIERGKLKVLNHGNLDSIRTLIDVRDAMETYWIACDKCEYGVPYNIGGTNKISVGEFLEVLKSKAKVKIICRQDPNLLRPTDVTNQVPGIARFEAATGWKQRYTLEESVEFLLEHCRRNH
jgi:GDP-4-dehydro-6-deoxy-D-mannose reductase